MTDTTTKSFAYRLFQFIRANKKALSAALPPVPISQFDKDGYVNRDAVRRLIDMMFQFEKYCRGAQQALAGNRDPKHFTVKAKARGLQPSSYHLDFVSNAAGAAERIVRRMLNCQAFLLGPTWQAVLSIEGMHNGSFNRVARYHIAGDRLPTEVSAFTGFSASLEDTGMVKMTFKNGAAENQLEQFFAWPNVEGLTLEEQIVRVNSHWTEIKHAVREAAKDSKNWPTLLDSQNVEANRVKNMLAEFYRGLRPDQKALLQKHPEEVKRFFGDMM